MKGVIAKTTGMLHDAEGLAQGSVNTALAATTGSSLKLGIGGVGRNTVSEGASARGDVSRISPGIGRGQWSLPPAPLK